MSRAYLDMPVIRVLEVATFYTMYNLVPVGKFHVQVCGTTPCMLRGSDDHHRRLQGRGMEKGHVTEDGLWTLTEVECMGNCATAPMVQINDGNYEDLTVERLDAVLDALAGASAQGRHAGTGPPHLRTVRRADDAERNGHREPRLPGGMVMATSGHRAAPSSHSTAIALGVGRFRDRAANRIDRVALGVFAGSLGASSC